MKLIRKQRMNQNKDSPGGGQSPDQIESQWLKAISRGDRQAFEAFYQAYFPRLLRFSHRITGQLNGLEEIVNDVMLVIWQKADTYDDTCRPSTWVFGIAYNKCRHALRREKRQSLNVALEDTESELFDRQNMIGDHETSEWLNAAFAILSPDQRTVLELTYFYGMSYQEIARIMKCPENTVKTRMFHARKKLQKILPGLAGLPTGELS
ncbi:MAG: hypothetical protein AXA67_05870 [Methylothermaceae bacteria B42]|nr:MAG: hypothetical protein AXA67_05870 [Methylothermaceae bacteria B42]